MATELKKADRILMEALEFVQFPDIMAMTDDDLNELFESLWRVLGMINKLRAERGH